MGYDLYSTTKQLTEQDCRQILDEVTANNKSCGCGVVGCQYHASKKGGY